MNVLVTGGAGFIGSHLIDYLLDAGHHVHCVDDLSLGRRDNLRHREGHPRFAFTELDLLHYDQLHEVFWDGAFQCVFHLAANSDIQAGTGCMNIDLNRTFLSTYTVLRCIRDHRVKQLVFASTSAIYGDRDELLHEDFGPLFPVSFYGAAKLASEAYIAAAVANFGLQAWIFRFPNVVGERTTHGVVHDFITALEKNPRQLTILGDGKQSKPYLYVKDLIEGIIFGWERAQEPLNYFNLGVESTITVQRIAEIVVEEMGLKRVEFAFTGGDRGWVGDVPRFRYDLAKIHRLGWRAKRTSEEAIRLAVRAELQRRGWNR
ncbi:MAG TPA: NAD-dependent epimerase/dehydratase family protein [Gemmataceae bacterium]|nr:NAD-dependent epimerase/dehydratase family protein [Gemmataceae bacterium]